LPFPFVRCRHRGNKIVIGTVSQTGMETIMIVGMFDLDSKTNTHTGYIQTLMLDFYGVQYRRNAKTSDKEPDYRVVIDRPIDILPIRT
jgi:hypothetical protein